MFRIFRKRARFSDIEKIKMYPSFRFWNDRHLTAFIEMLRHEGAELSDWRVFDTRRDAAGDVALPFVF